jgi:hypothetical protein
MMSKLNKQCTPSQITDGIGKFDVILIIFKVVLFYFTNNALSEIYDWSISVYNDTQTGNTCLFWAPVTWQKHGVWVHKNRFWIEISLFTRKIISKRFRFNSFMKEYVNKGVSMGFRTTFGIVLMNHRGQVTSFRFLSYILTSTGHVPSSFFPDSMLISHEWE